jgi:indolepyruvate ferredoxin oxidoreductase alpha subunit
VKWVKTVQNTYRVSEMRDLMTEALTVKTRGPKVIIAQSECTLNKQRRVRPEIAARIKAGKRVVKERFGIDPDTCTGDHSCIRINGCPSLTIAPNPDPMRKDPVATILHSCVGCGLCGEAAQAAVLCPSFYRSEIISNPNVWDKAKLGIRNVMISFLQNGIERRLKGIDA